MASVRRAAGGKKGVSVSDIEIVKESVDARKKPDVKLVYTVDFSCDENLPLDEAKVARYSLCDALGCNESDLENMDKSGPRPVIAGFGPCGIFAALILAEAGLRPVVLERGKPADERYADVLKFWNGGELNPESNVQFGEGGAGTFSDGKLTTGIKDIRIRKVLEEFVAAGADPSILYRSKPHIGTDRLREIIPAIRHRIESLGGTVHFNTKLEDLDQFEGTDLILAIGHSARDTFEMLLEKGLEMEQKPFSIGVRIRHPQEQINESQYGDPKLAEILGPADYKLNHRCENGRGVYTFCMCPGGHVVNSSSEDGTLVTNGMSNAARDGEFANSGLLVDVRTSDFAEACEAGTDCSYPLLGMEFQHKYERLAWENSRQAQREGKPDRYGIPTGTTYGNFRQDKNDHVRRSLPGFAGDAIIEAMPHLGRKLKGFDSDDAEMVAVETRSSSPVRILRDENMNAPAMPGVIPAGEGPGYAGGIMSAAVDGIKAAEQVIRNRLKQQV